MRFADIMAQLHRWCMENMIHHENVQIRIHGAQDFIAAQHAIKREMEYGAIFDNLSKMTEIIKVHDMVVKLELVPLDIAKKEVVSRQSVLELFNEIDCRIEHGAESNGHLTYVHQKLKQILGAL